MKISYRCNECPKETPLFESIDAITDHLQEDHMATPEDIEFQDISVVIPHVVR